MWLLLLSAFAVGSVHSVAIGYPYRTLWSYNPGQNQYALNNGGSQSNLRFLNNNNPQAVYAVHQIKYSQNSGSNQADISSRAACIRIVALERYQNIQRDIDLIKAQGKEPSSEILLKLQTLKTIAFTSDFSLIAELPEVKRTIQELEASISEQLGETKTYSGSSNTPLVVIDETAEQKQAREDHLRIYNEQIAQLRQLELEHEKYVKETSLKSTTSQLPTADKTNVEKLSNEQALAELERAQQEHFRAWNEAKLRSEQANKENSEKQSLETADKQQISEITFNQRAQVPFEQNKPSLQQTQQVFDTPEVLRAREEHLRLVDQAKLQNVQSNQAKEELNIKKISIPNAEETNVPQQVIDTPEVLRAREEHLRIVNEAVLKAQALEQQEALKTKQTSDQAAYEPIRQQVPIVQLQSSSNLKAEQPLLVDTPEVAKAREEHLRLVHEANLRAQIADQQDFKTKSQAISQQVPISEPQSSSPTFNYRIAQTAVEETPEIIKAREEHLRLVHEANLRAQSENVKYDSNNPSQQLIETNTGLNQQQLRFVEDTPEVQRAREEHLRIFNSIKSHTELEQAKESSRITPEIASHGKSVLESSVEEERILESERIREAERLQKEQEILALDRIREEERLAAEKLQMEAELKRLKLEEEQRLEMERLLEAKRLQEEQEELQKLKSNEYQEIIIQTDSAIQQPQVAIIPSSGKIVFPTNENIEHSRGQQVAGQYANNPFLRTDHVSQQPINRLEHQVNQGNTQLKSTSLHTQIPTSIYQHNSLTSHGAAQSSDNSVSAVRYVPSSHQSSGIKHQYIKDDNIKHKHLHNTASSQPADTAEVLIALERATNDHFRAHELALEQLRLARLQNPSLKDCN